MKVISNDECKRARGTYQYFKVCLNNCGCKRTNGSYESVILEDMICGETDGSSSCKGDSGGPYTVKKDDQHLLAGVTSWGYGCGEVK